MFSEPAPSSGNPLRIAVIGGGITGLAAAHRLVSRTDSVQVTLFEVSHRLGGIIRTEEADGFLLELGPDSFITNKPAGLDLCREIGFTDQLIPTETRFRRSLVLRNGKPLPVPEGFQLMVPSNPWSIMTTPILSLPGRLRLLAERFVRARTTDEDETLASFVIRRFGRQAYERLVQPLVGGIYTADPNHLSLRATLPRFLDMERSHGSVIRADAAQRKSDRSASRRSDETRSGSGARYGLFTAAKNGLSSFIAAIEQWLTTTGRVTFRLGCEVCEILPSSDNTIHGPTRHIAGRREIAATRSTLHTPEDWTLKFPSGIPETFDAIIVALPTLVAAKLLRISAFDTLASALNSIAYASSAIVVSGHRISEFAHPMDAFGLVIPAIERRKILAVSFSSRKFAHRAPEGTILLRTFVGGALQPELMLLDNDAMSAMVNHELGQIFGMRSDPLFSEVVRYNTSMPQYHVGHLDRVARIEALQSTFPGLQLAGSAFHGVGIPDSILSGRNAADRVLAAGIVGQP